MRANVQASNPAKSEYVRNVKRPFGVGPVRDGHGEAQEEAVVAFKNLGVARFCQVYVLGPEYGTMVRRHSPSLTSIPTAATSETTRTRMRFSDEELLTARHGACGLACR